MRRLLAVFSCALVMTAIVSSPALAMYHDRIANPVLHLLADVATAALVCAPILVFAGRGRLRTRRN